MKSENNEKTDKGQQCEWQDVKSTGASQITFNVGIEFITSGRFTGSLQACNVVTSGVDFSSTSIRNQTLSPSGLGSQTNSVTSTSSQISNAGCSSTGIDCVD